MRKKNRFHQIIFIFFFSITLALSPLHIQPANAWMTIKGEMFKTVLELLANTIRGIILGAMKTAATKMIDKAVSSFVGGSSSSDSKVITDYQDFLYGQPEEKAELFINDLLSQTTGGQSSSSYISAEGFGEGSAGYKKQLVSNFTESLKAQKGTLQNTYVGDPGENLFSEGNLDNFNSYLSGINNPWAFDLYAQQKYQEKLEEEKGAAQAKALAGNGFSGVEKDGKVITPGSLIGANMSNIMDMGNKMIAGATNPGEIITGAVQQVIMQTMQNGIGEIQSHISKEMQNIESYTNELDKLIGEQGPGAEYGNGSPAEPWVNPDSKAEPWVNPDLK